jgi:hypothetical protein
VTRSQTGENSRPADPPSITDVTIQEA